LTWIFTFFLTCLNQSAWSEITYIALALLCSAYSQALSVENNPTSVLNGPF